MKLCDTNHSWVIHYGEDKPCPLCETLCAYQGLADELHRAKHQLARAVESNARLVEELDAREKVSNDQLSDVSASRTYLQLRLANVVKENEKLTDALDEAKAELSELSDENGSLLQQLEEAANNPNPRD